MFSLLYTPPLVQRIVSQLSCQPSLFSFFHLFFAHFLGWSSCTFSSSFCLLFSFLLLFSHFLLLLSSHPHCLHALCIYAQRCEAQLRLKYITFTSLSSPPSILFSFFLSSSFLHQEETIKEEFLLPVRFCITPGSILAFILLHLPILPTDIPQFPHTER